MGLGFGCLILELKRGIFVETRITSLECVIGALALLLIVATPPSVIMKVLFVLSIREKFHLFLFSRLGFFTVLLFVVNYILPLTKCSVELEEMNWKITNYVVT